MDSEAPQRISIGLCILNTNGSVLTVQRPHDDLLWHMPEFPVEIETDLYLAVTSAMGLLLPDTAFSLIDQIDNWIIQKIPDYIAKQEGLTGATSEQQKWFCLKMNDVVETDKVNKQLYPTAQWVKTDQLMTLVSPHKRLTYQQVLEAFNTDIHASQKPALTNDFKFDSRSVSKKTRQNTDL